ncbi:MAG: hypothetical protein ACOX2F_12735 [bacterium]
MSKSGKVTEWFLNHDDKTLFNISYVALSVVVSIVWGIFWLVLIVAIHFFMDFVVNISKKFSLQKAIGYALWALKLDFALVLFSLTLAVYIDVVLGVLGAGNTLKGAVQAGSRMQRAGGRAAQVAGNTMKVGSRVLGWQKMIRTFFISIDDFARAIPFFLKKKKDGDETDAVESKAEKPVMEIKMTWSSLFSIALGVVMLVLFFLAPVILNQPAAEIWKIVAEELKP